MGNCLYNRLEETDDSIFYDKVPWESFNEKKIAIKGNSINLISWLPVSFEPIGKEIKGYSLTIFLA
jgi:hypothetical protein